MGKDTAQVFVVHKPSASPVAKVVPSRDDFHVYIWTACGNEQLALAL